MARYKLTLSYDGTAYFGWQKTRMGPSIQETLAHAIFQIAPGAPLPEAASRTDRGVHAEGQIVSIDLQKDWESKQLRQALNAHLPSDVRIFCVERAEADFHPTLQATGKEYRYHLCLGPVQDPIHRLYSWAHPPLDLHRMKKAAADLLGTLDFSAMAGEAKKNPICTIQQIDLTPLPGERLEISVFGNRFLYKMARNIVGTLVAIGKGKLPVDCLPELLASRDRKRAGMTAPAHGLTLFRVHYGERFS